MKIITKKTLVVSMLLLSFTLFANAQTTPDSNQSDTQNTETQNNNVPDILKDNNGNGTKKVSFSPRGIFNCQGGVNSPVGLPAAQPFVPVFDRAVHSQVQALTYKECILDKVASHNANAILAGITASTLKMINDNNLVIKDVEDYVKNAQIARVRKFVQEVCIEKAKKIGRETACVQIIEKFKEDILDPYKKLECPFDKETLNKFARGELDKETSEKILNYEQCTKEGFYRIARDLYYAELEKAKEKALYEAPSGIKPVKTKVKVPVPSIEDGKVVVKQEEKEIVVTPASVVTGQLNTALSSGLRRVEQVDEIDEMVQTLLANMHNRVLDAGRQGLYGIARSVGGDPAYTDLMTAQESAVANQFKGYTGIGSLSVMIAREKEYIQYKKQVVLALIDAIHKFREYENACFEQRIIPGAKEALAKEAEEESCKIKSQTQNHNPFKQVACNITANVNIQKIYDKLDIDEQKEANTIRHPELAIAGISAKSGDINIVASENGKTLKTTVANINSGEFSSKLPDGFAPDGEITIEANLPDGKSLKNSIKKETIQNISMLVLPNERYKLQITANSDFNVSKSATIKIDRSNSNKYVGEGSLLYSALKEALLSLKDANDTLLKLIEISNTYRNNQEKALYEIDQIVASRAMHSDSDLIKARQDAEGAQVQLNDFVQSTVQDEWENGGQGWCNKDKWQLFKVN